jgi:hypothetical protein
VNGAAEKKVPGVAPGTCELTLVSYWTCTLVGALGAGAEERSNVVDK